MLVTGEEYPVSASNQFLSTIATVVQMSILAFIFFGQTILDKMGIQAHPIMNQIQEKKFFISIAVFILGNMIRNGLLSSGAFEIYFDDELVFSKLESNTAPQMDIIDNLLQSYSII